MPRRPRQCPPGYPVHIVQRGNNRQVIFASDTDMKVYGTLMQEAVRKSGVLVHAWVFMANHVHALMTPERPDSISRCLQSLGGRYVRYFNTQYQRTGTLFEGRFKSSIVQSRYYYLACQRYIELNPVRAGIVTDPADYKWSSYRIHAFGQRDKLWTPNAEYLALGNSSLCREKAYRKLFEHQLTGCLLANIRDALNTGFVLGNDRFRRQVEILTGVRQRYQKRGPRTKQINS